MSNVNTESMAKEAMDGASERTKETEPEGGPIPEAAAEETIEL